MFSFQWFHIISSQPDPLPDPFNMASTLLTDSKIRALKPKTSAYYTWQASATRGTGRLGLKTYPSGRKVFVYRYYVAGKEKFIMLGDFPALSLAEALSKYQAAAADTSIIKATPVEHATIKQLFDDYIANQKRLGKRSYDKTENRLNQVLKSPHINENTPARDITPTHIKMVLAEVIERNAIAGSNKIRTALHAVFNFGLHSDNDPAKIGEKTIYGLTMNPVTVVPPQAGASRALDRFLSWDELHALVVECRKSALGCSLPTDHAQLVLLCIFTGGQRPWELMTNLKTNWDKSNNTLTVPPDISKNGDYHVIPLCKSAISVLEEMERRHSKSPHIFPAETKEGHLLTSEFAKQINKFCKRTEFEKFTPRDIRRTFKTLGGEMGLSSELRDRVQNHKKPGVSSKHYDRYDYLKEKREAVDLWEERIMRMFNSPKETLKTD
ncbi:tyrosine-type recombinase/integrase [Yersinia frederiksenii]|uniref:tyrosine-type recombinase/integrase n=1 Tax=Yersinia frederiksenii TaxID=29484 RepID=UPI001D0528B7|nr:site-specific integrase [Yersinia frederiksenii]